MFKEDRVVEFDGLLSANTLVEFLLDVSKNTRMLSLMKKLLSMSCAPFSLPPAAGGASGGDRKCVGAESL